MKTLLPTTNPTANLDERLAFEAELQHYRDEGGHLLFVDHKTLGRCVVDPQSRLASVIRGQRAN